MDSRSGERISRSSVIGRHHRFGGRGQRQHRCGSSRHCDGGERRRRVLDGGEDRNRAIREDPAGRGVGEDRLHRGGFVADVGGNLFRRRAFRGAEAGQPVLAAGVAAEIPGHQDRVDLVAALQHRVCAGITVRVHLAGACQVDGVDDLGLRPEDIPQAGLRRRRQRGHLEPGGLGDVARDHAMAATVGEHRDPRSARRCLRPQGQQHVGELARGLHLDRACDRAGHGDHGGIAGQRAGVGLRTAGRSRACPGGQHNDRCPVGDRGGGRLDESAAVAKVLDIDGDRRRRGVGGARFDQLDKGHVRLIAKGHEPRNAQSACREQPVELDGEVAALAEHGHAARRELVRRQVRRRRVIHQPKTIGSDQERTSVADPRDQGVLAGAALGAGFAETRGDRNDRSGPLGQHAVHRVLEAGLGHRDDGKVDRPFEVVDRAHGGPAELPPRRFAS